MFLVLLNKMRMLGESKISGVNQGNEGRKWVASKIFFHYPGDLGTSHQFFRERGGVFSAFGVFVSD